MSSMTGFMWLLVIWSLTYYGWRHFNVHRLGRTPVDPLLLNSLLAVVLAASAAGEASTTNVIGIDTVVRGFLASAALVFAVRILLVHSSIGLLRRAQHTNLLLLTGYAAIAAISTLYSVAPLHTAGKAYELSVALAIVWAFATRPDAPAQLRGAIDFVMALLSAMVLIPIPGFFLLPSRFTMLEESRPGFVFEATMGAPYAHSNTLSAVGAIVAGYAVAQACRSTAQLNRRWWTALAMASSVSILLASGRQGVVIWAVSVGLVLFLYARPLFVFALIPTTAYILTYFGTQLFAILTRDQQDSTLYTLSSRITWWEGAVDAWMDSPLVGYGFGVGGRFVALPRIGQSGIGSLHNGYFEALVGVGLIGILPLIVVVARLLRWSWLQLQRGSHPHIAILIIPLTLHSAISLGFAAWLSTQFVIFALLAAYADHVPMNRYAWRSAPVAAARKARGGVVQHERNSIIHRVRRRERNAVM